MPFPPCNDMHEQTAGAERHTATGEPGASVMRGGKRCRLFSLLGECHRCCRCSASLGADQAPPDSFECVQPTREPPPARSSSGAQRVQKEKRQDAIDSVEPPVLQHCATCDHRQHRDHLRTGSTIRTPSPSSSRIRTPDLAPNVWKRESFESPLLKAGQASCQRSKKRRQRQ